MCDAAAKPGLAYGVQDFGLGLLEHADHIGEGGPDVGVGIPVARHDHTQPGRQSARIIGRTFRFTNHNGRTTRAAKTPPLPASRASGGDRGRRLVDCGGDQGRRPVDSGGDRGRRKGRPRRRLGQMKINSSSADRRGGQAGFRPRQHPPCIPRRCTLDLDFAMSAAGVDLTNFFKVWGRSRGFKRLG